MNTVLVFCENAVSGSDGKLDVEGIFNELYAPGFPARQDRLILAGIIEWDRHTEGTQPFVIHLLDPDNKPIFTIEGRSDVGARPDTSPPARTHLILPLENLVFIRPGQYRTRMELQDLQITGPSLYLIEDRHRIFKSGL